VLATEQKGARRWGRHAADRSGGRIDPGADRQRNERRSGDPDCGLEPAAAGGVDQVATAMESIKQQAPRNVASASSWKSPRITSPSRPAAQAIGRQIQGITAPPVMDSKETRIPQALRTTFRVEAAEHCRPLRRACWTWKKCRHPEIEAESLRPCVRRRAQPEGRGPGHGLQGDRIALPVARRHVRRLEEAKGTSRRPLYWTPRIAGSTP